MKILISILHNILKQSFQTESNAVPKLCQPAPYLILVIFVSDFLKIALLLTEIFHHYTEAIYECKILWILEIRNLNWKYSADQLDC